MKQLLVATTNKNKVAEIQALLSDDEFTVISFSDIDTAIPDVAEDGATFKENAIKKASEIARTTGYVSLADDSGLCVDALNGEPGVYSARFAGPEKNDQHNCHKVLELMKGCPHDKRRARFVCAIAIANPQQVIDVVEGVCEGYIADGMKGSNGFGYDPIFIYPSINKTFAEIDREEKNRISHRRKALEAIKHVLKRLSAE